MREDLDQTASAVHGAVQKDVAQLEQSIATNVTRMAHGTLDAVSRAERNINAPAACFYAIEASRVLGLGDAGALRIGLAPYNSDEDVDRLLDALGEIVAA